MLEKKILTVISAIAILACGACFLPPLPDHRPPPPPARLTLEDIQSVRVEAANISESHHLESVDLAQGIAHAITEQTWKAGASAFTGKGDRDADAVLTVTVVREELVRDSPPTSTSARRASFLIVDSATLTRRDGLVLWRETEVKNPISRLVPEERPPDVWKDSALMMELENELSRRIVFRMSYAR